MRKWVVTIGGLCLMLTLGRAAPATTATDGTLITNVASGSYQSAAGVQFWISYAVTAWVLVSNPCVAMTKIATPTAQSSGGNVTFQLCVMNCSASSSSFNVIVTDQLPAWMAMNAGGAVLGSPWTYYTTTGSLGWIPTNSSLYSGAPWNANLPANGQAAPWYLRFSLDILGIGKSACVGFVASVL